jgi:hypothetical protein
MDPFRNPFAPGAGTPPPELAGRGELLAQTKVALARIRAGRPARSLILYGLRGVGKTVLLTTMRNGAEAAGMMTVSIEAPENRSLPGVLIPPLRAALLRLDRVKRVGADVSRALRALAGFAKLKAKYGDVEVTLEIDPEPGLADSGDLEADLTDLIIAVGETARERDTAVVLAIDELQYVPEQQLAALIMALHRANQRTIPVTLIGAGLPPLLAQMGEAKSYAERLFQFVPIGALDRSAAEEAIRLPIQREGEMIESDAVAAILRSTQGYPYFLQEWGKHSWDVAPHSPISADDVVIGGVAAIAELDASFFRVRFDQLAPSEKRYLRAMADLGPGHHRSGDIADQLGVKVTTVAPTRNSLIRKGMLYSPAHGDTAFTVPLFDEFLKRVMPTPLPRKNGAD